MKKAVILVTMLIVGGNVYAATVFWSEDFSVNTSLKSTAFGARIGDGISGTGILDQWYSGGPGVNAGVFELDDNERLDKPRAVVIALDADALGMTAGDYILTYDFTVWNNMEFNVQVWDCQAGGTSGDYYTIKYADNNLRVNQVLANGSAQVTQLAAINYPNTSGGQLGLTEQTLSFTYAGEGDIGLMFSTATYGDFYKGRATIDNISIMAKPAPPKVRLLIINE